VADVSDAKAEVLNFREEARGCLQLAQAEELREVRTVLMGMAMGWLKLANGNPRPTSSPGLIDNRNERDAEDRRFDAFSGVAEYPTFVPGTGDYYILYNNGESRRRARTENRQCTAAAI